MTDTTKAGRTRWHSRPENGQAAIALTSPTSSTSANWRCFSMSSPAGQLLVQSGGGTDLGVSAAIAGMGILYLFEDWLEPHLASGALEPCWSRGG